MVSIPASISHDDSLFRSARSSRRSSVFSSFFHKWEIPQIFKNSQSKINDYHHFSSSNHTPRASKCHRKCNFSTCQWKHKTLRRSPRHPYSHVGQAWARACCRSSPSARTQRSVGQARPKIQQRTNKISLI